MPVILKPEAYSYWLSPANKDIAYLKKILDEQRLIELISYPVSMQVNSTRNNNASIIEPIQESR
jgi:putative SOS response-associated peptidase YedK